MEWSKQNAKAAGFSQKETTAHLVIFQLEKGKKEIGEGIGNLVVSTCDKIYFPRWAGDEEIFWFKKTKKEFKKKFKENDRLFIENRFTIETGGRVETRQP